jgi:hypothetical protein
MVYPAKVAPLANGMRGYYAAATTAARDKQHPARHRAISVTVTLLATR